MGSVFIFQRLNLFLLNVVFLVVLQATIIIRSGKLAYI
ncbi:MAG: hypothetical protein CM15mP58_16350 [Burkholderiaceae bacterium]|nr:MAG: hypothetical protein CM15mP58_16350 [Burkholderiaceae bacterium]